MSGADDPWAKWRQPAAKPAANTERRPAAPPAAEPAKPQPLAGTLSPLKKAAPEKKKWAGKPSPHAPASTAKPPPPPAGEGWGGGKPDARRAKPSSPPPSRPSPASGGRRQAEDAAAPSGVRLSKVMSERGLCSRREADLWIERGWVFVDGLAVTELGSRIDPGAAITIAREAEKDQAKQVTILLHKPVGYVSGQPEPGCKPAVALISAETWTRQSGDPEFKPWMLRGLAPAGRLDVDSTGLLVLTQDGRIARKLIGETSDIEKEYLVRVSGEMIAGGLELLRHGLQLDGKALKPAWVKQLNEDQLHFILKEGKKRQIRRMCELVGLRVTGLKRVRIGKVRLGDLPLGRWRFLRPDEHF